MFSANWENTDFFLEDQSFYEECGNFNKNASENCSELPQSSSGIQQKQFYTTKINEQIVNINNMLQPANVHPSNINSSCCDYQMPKNDFVQANTTITTTRHHPYQQLECSSSNHCEYLKAPNVNNCFGNYQTVASNTAYQQNYLINEQKQQQQQSLNVLQQQQPANVFQQVRQQTPMEYALPNNSAQLCPRIATTAPPSFNRLGSNCNGDLNVLRSSGSCSTPPSWSYAYCYGYGYPDQEPCQYTQFVDIEDFMNNEKRKEKSRDAARCRRSRETEIFSELAQVLPLKQEDVNQLDKASIMRIAIAYLKIRDMLQLFPKMKDLIADLKTDNDAEFLANDAQVDIFKQTDASQMIKETLDGFLLVLSNDGDITYVSDNVIEYLGITKIDILGQQVWEYAHQCDHAELKDALNIKRNGLSDKVKDEHAMEEGLSTDHRDLFVRFKCTLTSRGRSINIKSASYKVIHITGHLVVNSKGDRVLIAVGRPIPHPSNIEIPLGTTTFLTKHSLDMKFTYVDDKMLDLFGYKPEDLLEKSLFSCHHGVDSDHLMATYKSVLTKGQGETCRYRFLGKHGGYCWIVTQATIVYDKLKPQSVVCVNYVISNLENNNEIYSLAQYEASQQQKIEENIENNNNNCEDKPVQPKEATIEINKKAKPITTEIPATKIQENNKKSETEKSAVCENSSIDKIKCEQVAGTAAATITQALLTSTHKLFIDNNKPITIRDQPKSQNFPPSPLCRNLSPINSININNNKQEEKRPKSVTATVFRAADSCSLNANSITNINNNNNKNQNSTTLPQQSHVATRPTTVTASIFANSTATAAILNQQQRQTTQQKRDMNKGFLSFSGDDATELTMLKEEPDEFVSLPPNAVDASMHFDDLVLGLMSSYGSFLPEDINSLDSTTSSTTAATTETATQQQQRNSNGNYSTNSNNTNNGTTTANSNNGNNNKGAHIDPFINYREESNDTNCSQHLLSPSVTSKSPEASSLPSLCSPNSLSQEDDFAFMTMSVDDDIDLTTRAPYIPMNDEDDLPLLTADDLMWCGGNTFVTEELNMKDVDAMQQLQLQQQQISDNLNYQQQQQQPMTQQQFSNSLCSSPASTMSSMSPSPVNHQQQQQQQHNPNNASGSGMFPTDTSELAALLCGAGNGTLSILGNSDNGNVGIGVIDGSERTTTTNLQQQQQTLNDLRLHQLQQQFQEHERQQREREQLLSLGLNGKKEKLENARLTTNLCESIEDALYNKDSTNLDCLNELLQINVNDPTATQHEIDNARRLGNKQQQKQLQLQQLSPESHQQEQHNVAILNSIPLIAIQGDKTVLLQEQEQEQQKLQQQQVSNNKIVINDEMLSARPRSNSKVTTIKIPPTIVNRTPLQLVTKTTILQQQQQQLPQHGSKRHMPGTAAAQQIDTKRLKSTSVKTNDIQTSPQLLQQLMAPMQQISNNTIRTTIAAPTTVATIKQETSIKQKATINNQRWSANGVGGNGVIVMDTEKLLTNNVQQQQQQQQQTNSVLKNLLISGCDVSAGYCILPMRPKKLAKA